MKASTKRMSIAEIDQKLDHVENMMKELTLSKLVIAEREYNLSEWITASDYAKKHNLAIARVHNWITRGVIPANCIVIIPELNHLKLIKDQTYETRATK